MKLLCVNAGSSSLKFQLFEMPEEKVLISGYFEKIGLGIGIVLALIACGSAILSKSYVYDTYPLCDTESHPFDGTYKVSLQDKEYGEVELEKQTISNADGDKEIFYCVHSKFVKAGKTAIILESPEGEKRVFDIEIKKNTYDIEEREEK